MTNLFRKQLDLHFQRSQAFRSVSGAQAKGAQSLRVHGPRGAYLSLVIDRLHARAEGGTSLVVVPTELEAEAIVQDVESFGTTGAVLFPWWGTVAYEGASPLASIFGGRVSTLTRIAAGEELLIVAPLRALLTPVPPPGYLAARTLSVKKGQTLDPQQAASQLAAAGYLRVPSVSIHGELAVRGEVIDVFIPGQELAVRLTLDFDTVSTIRRFDPINQGSTESIERIDITPCREVILGTEELGRLSAGLREQGYTGDEVEAAVSSLADDSEAGGVETFYPLCFESSSSLMDYLGPSGQVYLIDEERLLSSAASLRKEHLELFRRARAAKKTVPGPQKILLDLPALLGGAPRRVDFAADAGNGAISASFRWTALVLRQLHVLPRRNRVRPEERLLRLHLRRLRRSGGAPAAHPQGPARGDPSPEHLRGLCPARTRSSLPCRSRRSSAGRGGFPVPLARPGAPLLTASWSSLRGTLSST